MKSLMASNPDLRLLMQQSLAQAAVANPHRETNPVRTIDEWLAYIERFLHHMPWQTMDIGEGNSFFRRIDQNIGYFYYLIDQPLDELKGLGYIYPSLQYEPRMAAWLKDYNTAWGEWLNSPDSWSDSYYNLARADARFELASDRYESPANWHSWNDFFTRRLSKSCPPVNRTFLSPSDGEIAFAPVKTASIANWLNLLGDNPYRKCFTGGETTHIVLDVFDYHRFHAPCDGTVLECNTVPGIHAGGGVIIWDEVEHRYRYDQLGVTDFQMLETRGVLVMETPDWGKIALVAVGVQQVSSVLWTHPALANSKITNSLTRKITLHQGEELGSFRFGGSDIVLFFEPGKAPHITPRTVKVGEKIA
ncbi:MAG: phosphatidylserine decarboxylase [Paludibacteraceae bacterium]|nr:phosphatidylserine decarboxylase [Paludibacteraceae bacterium]